jgi:hypothetical protein
VCQGWCKGRGKGVRVQGCDKWYKGGARVVQGCKGGTRVVQEWCKGGVRV